MISKTRQRCASTCGQIGTFQGLGAVNSLVDRIATHTGRIYRAQAVQKRRSYVHNHPESGECPVNSVFLAQYLDLRL